MKKIKWTLMSLAILLAVGGAFATRPHWDCSNLTQYYMSGGQYFAAGVEGLDYICTGSTGTCTYYTPDAGLHYYQCQIGTYCTSNCIVRGNPKPAKPQGY
jgi:hypothetical protein